MGLCLPVHPHLHPAATYPVRDTEKIIMFLCTEVAYTMLFLPLDPKDGFPHMTSHLYSPLTLAICSSFSNLTPLAFTPYPGASPP